MTVPAISVTSAMDGDGDVIDDEFDDFEFASERYLWGLSLETFDEGKPTDENFLDALREAEPTNNHFRNCKKSREFWATAAVISSEDDKVVCEQENNDEKQQEIEVQSPETQEINNISNFTVCIVLKKSKINK